MLIGLYLPWERSRNRLSDIIGDVAELRLALVALRGPSRHFFMLSVR